MNQQYLLRQFSKCLLKRTMGGDFPPRATMFVTSHKKHCYHFKGRDALPLPLRSQSTLRHEDGNGNGDSNNSSTDPLSPVVEAEVPLCYQRMWVAGGHAGGQFWNERVVDKEDEESILFQIGVQELSGSRMKSRQQGVLHEDPAVDMRLMTQNYTVASLASALRDREDALQQAAVLAETGTINQLKEFLKIFHPKYVIERRERKVPDITKRLDEYALEWLRKTLMRMPRSVVSAHNKRAAVVLPLCTVQGIPCLLLEKRARHLRAHADEVCLPGGMYCEAADKTIVATCLREMREEIVGLAEHYIHVLGVFRINWGEVHHLVGVAVTPVVCSLGELPAQLNPNPDEVSQVFTISLDSLADSDLWIQKQDLAPQFVGGPYPIWGLTGYILDRFRKDVLLQAKRGASSKAGSGAHSLSEPIHK